MVAVLILATFGISMDIAMNWGLKKYFPWHRREGT
jgi:ABC-type nitrate/sulfonate/bicarbonate transport system permease component